MKINIINLVPDFILADRNGYALSKAIEAGMIYADRIIGEALAIMKNVDVMPEWRLDEIAYDTGCLYDFTEDIDKKRYWIKNLSNKKNVYGTPYALEKYMEAYFDKVKVLDNQSDGLEPYHFKLLVDGAFFYYRNTFLARSVDYAKNARSVFDGFIFTNYGESGIITESEIRMDILDYFILDVSYLS